MPTVGTSTTFQDIGKADQIGVNISVRIDERMADAGLCGEMHHVREAVVSEQIRHAFALGNIDLFEMKIRKPGKFLYPRFLQARVVVIIEIIEPEYRVTTFQ